MFEKCYLPFAQTTQNKGGAYLFDIHFWIGKDTSQVLISKTLLFSKDCFWKRMQR
jgi:hypothetical protein